MAIESTQQDRRPSLQFYPSDWLTDTGLRLCSLAARGLWVDCLCFMWSSPVRGMLLVPSKPEANGSRIEKTTSRLEAKGLAKLVGDSEANVKQLLSELEANNVYSTLEDGTIYNRRMYRDWKQSLSKAEAGRKGGLASKTQAQPQAKVPPSSSSPTPTPSSTPHQEAAAARLDARDFDLFWRAYPRKVGKDAATKAWHNMKPPIPDTAAILNALKLQARQPQWIKDDGQFIPHPATWINQRRWEDEAVKATAGTYNAPTAEQTAVQTAAERIEIEQARRETLARQARKSAQHVNPA